jgi:hypothetical protein
MSNDLNKCHCGLDPQSMTPTSAQNERHGSRIKSGMTYPQNHTSFARHF